MKYLPIMDELFSSDSVIFLLIGLVAAFAIGLRLKADKKRIVGITASIVVYGLCEVICNRPTSFFMDIISLFVGTIALGCFVGFLVTWAVCKVKRKI